MGLIGVTGGRIRNKGKQRAVELVDPRNGGLRKMLQDAEYAVMHAGDVVNLDHDHGEEEGGVGSASDEE